MKSHKSPQVMSLESASIVVENETNLLGVELKRSEEFSTFKHA